LGGAGNYSGNGPSCTTPQCVGIGLGSFIGGLLGMILFVFSIGYCFHYCKGRPFRKNSTFVNKINVKHLKQEVSNANPFHSGIWSSRYFQYTRWHGPYQFSLLFDPQSMKVTGSGSDDVGKFTIDGTYSTETSRIALTQKYQAGTGNLSENLGHQVTIQLTWNAQNNQFEGKWYVQTSEYHDEDKFELKFNGQQLQPPAYEKV